MWQIISDYIGVLILNLGVIYFAKKVLEIKTNDNKIKRFLICFLSTSLFFLTFSFFKGTIKTLIVDIIYMIELKILFKLSYFKAMFLTFISTVLLMVSEVLEFFIVVDVIEIGKGYSDVVISGSIIGNSITCLFFILLTVLLKKWIQKIVDTEVSNNLKILILFFLTLVSVLLFFYSLIKEFDINYTVIQYLIAIGVLTAVLYNLIKQTIENNKLTQEYDQLLEFMKTYEIEIENQRILRHETKNEFRTIRAKICDKQKEAEIIEYIDEIVNDKYEVKQEEYAKFRYLPPNGIKGLCYFKTQEAKNKGIKVALNISKRVEQSTIYKLNLKQQREFGKILGVFLDNAIEASAESGKKELGIEAYVNKENEFKIIISNTFNNKIDKEKIGKENFSTKGKTRGHGLLLVKRITEMNKYFEIKSEIRGDVYVQTLIIKKHENSNSEDHEIGD